MPISSTLSALLPVSKHVDKQPAWREGCAYFQASCAHARCFLFSRLSCFHPSKACLILSKFQTKPLYCVSRLKGKLASLDLADKLMSHSQMASKEYKSHCQKRVAELNSMLKPAKENVKKLEKSPNKDAFSEHLQELDQLIHLGTALSDLIAFMPNPSPEPEEFLGRLENCAGLEALGSGLGPGFVMKSLMAKADEASLHGDFEAFCAILSRENEQVTKLLLHDTDLESLQGYLEVEVGNRLLAVLRRVTEKEIHVKVSAGITEELTPNLHEAWSLASADKRPATAAFWPKLSLSRLRLFSLCWT